MKPSFEARVPLDGEVLDPSQASLRARISPSSCLRGVRAAPAGAPPCGGRAAGAAAAPSLPETS